MLQWADKDLKLKHGKKGKKKPKTKKSIVSGGLLSSTINGDALRQR